MASNQSTHTMTTRSKEIITSGEKVDIVSKTPKIFKTSTKKLKHEKGWNKNTHYMGVSVNHQCGQSCPCCRARVFKSGIDPDAKFGACLVCLSL